MCIETSITLGNGGSQLHTATVKKEFSVKDSPFIKELDSLSDGALFIILIKTTMFHFSFFNTMRRAGF